MYYVAKYVHKWVFFEIMYPPTSSKLYIFMLLPICIWKQIHLLRMLGHLFQFLSAFCSKFIASSCITLNERRNMSRTRSSMENAILWLPKELKLFRRQTKHVHTELWKLSLLTILNVHGNIYGREDMRKMV